MKDMTEKINNFVYYQEGLGEIQVRDVRNNIVHSECKKGRLKHSSYVFTFGSGVRGKPERLSEHMYGYIYITVFRQSGKAYIGKHKGKPDINYKGSGKLLKKALDKYGFDNAETYIIDAVYYNSIYGDHIEQEDESTFERRLSELESKWLKHKLGVNIESSSIQEFYNLETAFTKVNMNKQIKNYYNKLQDLVDKKVVKEDFIVAYKKLNLIFNKKELLSILLDYDSLPKIIKSIIDFDVSLSHEERILLLSEYSKDIPCLFDTMYNTFFTEINLLSEEMQYEFIEDNRYEPFQPFITKYFVYIYKIQKGVINNIEEVKEFCESSPDWAHKLLNM